MNILRPVLLSGLLLLAFGFAFPGLVWAVGLLVPERAAGSAVVVAGKTVGFEQIGQKFMQARYFHGRPSAVDYNGAATGASNTGPTNPALQAAVQARLDTFLLQNPIIRKEQVPAELVTASASGLDPDLSPIGAAVQAARVAQARQLNPARVRALIAQHTELPWLGFMGPARVNVLRLNLALDQIQP
ncbi:MAG TPA: potassium-transporting ATPase subunit KdpC [Hymenobacter sp.]